MATGGEGSYEGGGAGGKFRKKPFRRSSTPYDRPSNAIRKSSEAGRTSWLLKLVDPASKIITSSAQKFFSSVFGKNLPPALPPPIPEAHQDSRDESPEVVYHNTSEAKERVSSERVKLDNSSDANSLEQILKQNTFTRAEINRLTELLKSRAIDVSFEDEKKISEPSTSRLAASHRTESVPVQENQSQSLLMKNSPPFNEEDVATPAELAKAYMGSRTSNITPSKLGLRSQVVREDTASLAVVPFAPKSPSMALVPRSAVNYNSASRVSRTGNLTPAPRGRSALYRMACTPYSRVQHSSNRKAVGFMTEGNAEPSGSSQWLWDNSGGKQASKRRSSFFDNDIGSVGPIRRIRQKTNMMSPSRSLSLRSPATSLSIPLTPVGSDFAQASMSSIEKPLQLTEPKHNNLGHGPMDNGDGIASTSSVSVPTQSSEMARKILQQLDKFMPSPKEKSPELKLAAALDKSPTKLTHSMLSGRALKSMEDVDSSNLLHTSHCSDVSDGVGNNRVPVTRDSTSQKQVKFHENGPKKNLVSRDKGAEANGVTTLVSAKDTVPRVKAGESVISSYDTNPSQKKCAFQMSAHEDSLDSDEDTRVGSIPIATSKGKSDFHLVESKAIVTEALTTEKMPVSSSEINPPASVSLTKPSTMEGPDTFSISEHGPGFIFPNKHAPITCPEPAMPQQSSLFDKAVPHDESAGAPVFGFGPKSGDKATPFTVSSTPVSGSSVPKFGTQLNTLSSDVTAATRSTPIAVESDKVGTDESQKAGDLFKKSERAISQSASLFSFGASNSNSTLNNGSLASTSSLFSVPAASPILDKSTNNVFSGISKAPTSTLFSSDTTSTTTSTTAPIATTAATNMASHPFVSAATTCSTTPMFQFGSSSVVAPPASTSAPLSSASTGTTSIESELKTKHTSPFGSLNSSPFGATPTFTGSSSSPFVFGVSTPSSVKTSSSENNQFQSSNTSAAITSASSSVQATPATVAAPFTQSTHMAFTSSASPTFGLSGSSSFSFGGGSVFGSSPSANNLFGSSSGFGTSSSTTFSASSGTTSSLLSSASQPATSPIFGSGFGSTSSSAGFTLGGSSPMFSFTSAGGTTSSAPNSSSFPVFGASTAVAAFGSASPGTDQMNMEDSMAEDTMQASTPAVPGFGQTMNVPPSNLIFGGSPSGSLFPSNGQQTPPATQSLTPFQASGSLGFSAGGSFSLGTGGGDKSNRKIIKVRKTRKR